MFNFANKTVLVTGANRGIGAQIAKSFLEHEANVVMHFRSESDESKKLISELRKDYSNQLSSICFDLSNGEQIKNELKILLKDNPVDILVNNAGVTHNMILQMTSEDDLYMQYEINTFAPFRIMQLVLRKMVRAKQGSIINISSSAAFDGNQGKSIYGGTKAALIAMSKSLSREVGPYGIRVNCIAPGITETDMLSSMTEDVINESINQSDLKRSGRPIDIANAVMFLASEKSSYITGQTIRVDGGM